ncbi:hypothetical protein RKE29_30645, partial [Streptomyces sp. B1866]|nr:hypothetical protein [Streptomyces sp. B1866]
MRSMRTGSKTAVISGVLAAVVAGAGYGVYGLVADDTGGGDGAAHRAPGTAGQRAGAAARPT